MKHKQYTKVGLILMAVGFLGLPLVLSFGYGLNFDTNLSFEDTQKIDRWVWPVMLLSVSIFVIGAVLSLVSMLKAERKK